MSVPPASTAQSPPAYPPANGQVQTQPVPAAQPYAGALGGAPPPATATSPTPRPAGPLAATDPSSLQAILAGIQGAIQGVLVAPGSLPVDLAEAGLRAHALRTAPGMKPEGDELKQNLAEGQHAVVMLTLQAGKCYAVLGFSSPTAVRELDLNLLAPPLYITLAGQDLAHSNTPAIGATPNAMCPVIAIPLQYKLDVFARSGSGPVVVQLYSKSKG